MAEWILLLTQQLLKVTNMCSHTCAKTLTPLVSCIVNDVVVNRMPSVQCSKTLQSLFMLLTEIFN